MNPNEQRARFVLLREFRPSPPTGVDLNDLRRQLDAVPDLQGVEIASGGRSTVVASVPARNHRQKERLKALLGERIQGWRVIDEQKYQLPATF